MKVEIVNTTGSYTKSHQLRIFVKIALVSLYCVGLINDRWSPSSYSGHLFLFFARRRRRYLPTYIMRVYVCLSMFTDMYKCKCVVHQAGETFKVGGVGISMPGRDSHVQQMRYGPFTRRHFIFS